jgi:hypothetical protein
MSEAVRPPVAFYCVCDDRYFLGAVAMINSLRLQGHTEPIFLLDCGLTRVQRELLTPEVRFVASPYETIPLLLNTIAPIGHPAEVMILIDADMIVTRPLTALIEEAGRGRVVAFRTSYDRFVPEWGELLELGQIRRQPYVCGGLVFFGGAVGAEVISLMDELEAFVELDFKARNLPPYPSDYPFVALDQDVLNAILGSRVAPARITALDYRLAPNQPFDGLRIRENGDMRCSYADGAEPYVVHHLARKPWHERMPTSVYSRLLRRQLVGPGLTIEVPAGEIPRWLGEGLLPRLARGRVDARDRLGWYLRDHLPRPIMRRIDARRQRAFTGR